MKNYFAEIMSKYKLKQIDVAKLLNTKQATISGYNTGKRHPDFSVFIKLAEHLNVSLDELFQRDENFVMISREEYNKLLEIKKLIKEVIKDEAK